MLKITLKELSLKDADKIFIYLQDPELSKYSGPYKAASSVEMTIEYIKKSWERRKNASSLICGIYLSNKIVGIIGLTDISNKSSEVGFWLAKEFWGRGIMSTALKKILIVAKEQRLEKIYAYTKKENIAAEKVLLKTGFNKKENKQDNYFETSV